MVIDYKRMVLGELFLLRYRHQVIYFSFLYFLSFITHEYFRLKLEKLILIYYYQYLGTFGAYNRFRRRFK
jgi:hypothetical protein